jgi:L-iditol 2-dehydrogenase
MGGLSPAQSIGGVRVPVSLPVRNKVVACLGGARTILEERPLTPPGDRELLLRLRAVGFCGTDLFKLENGTAHPGSVLGHELVGEVAAAGAGIRDFRPGDRVSVPHHVPCGTCLLCRRGAETMCEAFQENLLHPGAFAEHVLVKPRAVALAARKLPEHLGDDTAVFMEPAACVLRAVHQAELASDGLAVIQGGGSMGLLHLLVLRAVLPGARVLVVDPVPERRRLAERLGADAGIAPGDPARQGVSAVSDGLGADAVFDTVGGAALLASALTLTRPGGVVVLFAHAGAGERAGFELNALFKHERKVLGSYSGGLREQQAVFALMVDGRLDPSPLVSHRLTLDEFATGVALARERQALKIVFTPTATGESE